MKVMVVKFLLRNVPCGFISALMTEAEARNTVRTFLSGEWKLRDRMIAGNSDSPYGGWGVRWEDVAAVHTFDPEEQVIAQPIQPFVPKPTQPFNPFPVSQPKTNLSGM